MGDPEDVDQDGIALPEMVELEAVYTYVRTLEGDESEHAGKRQKIVNRVLKVLKDPRDPEHEQCKAIVVEYLKGKMLALKRLAQPMARSTWWRLHNTVI